ncbi:MAG: MarR family winged helix-turn-helix transcriptional regulator [Solimonas sp.]
MSADQPRSRQRAIERALAGAKARLPDLPYELILAARLMSHAHKQSQQLINEVMKAHELNYGSYSTLMVLYGAGPEGIGARELSEATGEKPNNLTRLCDELHARKLLHREPGVDDRRRVMLRLTRSGEKLAEQIQPEIWAVVEHLYRDFTPAELRQMQRLFGKLLDAGEAAIDP